MEHPGGNVQQAVENVGLEKGTWVRTKDNTCESHPLGGNRKSWEEMAALKMRRKSRDPTTEPEWMSLRVVRGGEGGLGTGVFRKGRTQNQDKGRKTPAVAGK